MIVQRSIPKPETFEMLEDIARFYFSKKYNEPFNKWGRPGQAQHGIDVYGIVNKRVIAVQCKCHNDGDLTPVEIDSEIGRVSRSMHASSISEFYFVTTAKRDVNAQTKVQLLTKYYNFSIHIIYWDEFEAWLLSHSEFLHLFYPDNGENCDADTISIKEFRKLCYIYNVYDVLYMSNWEHIISEKLLLDSDGFDIEMDALIKRTYGINKDLLEDLGTFKEVYKNALTNFAMLGRSNGSVVIADLVGEQKEAMSHKMKILSDIYRKYKTV